MIIFQVSNDGAAKSTPPTKANLDAWLNSIGQADAAGIDPRRRTSPLYVQYSSSAGGWVGSVPHNMLIDGRTLKILEKKVSPTQLTSSFQKYLQ